MENGASEEAPAEVDVRSMGKVSTNTPGYISETDRLRVRVVELEMTNGQLELRLLQQQVSAVAEKQREAQKKITSLRDEMLEKYDIDLYTAKINDDGSVLLGPVMPSPNKAS